MSSEEPTAEGDDVPEYPGGDRDVWLNDDSHIDIEDIDEKDERLK